MNTQETDHVQLIIKNLSYVMVTLGTHDLQEELHGLDNQLCELLDLCDTVKHIVQIYSSDHNSYEAAEMAEASEGQGLCNQYFFDDKEQADRFAAGIEAANDIKGVHVIVGVIETPLFAVVDSLTNFDHLLHEQVTVLAYDSGLYADVKGALDDGYLMKIHDIDQLNYTNLMDTISIIYKSATMLGHTNNITVVVSMAGDPVYYDAEELCVYFEGE